MSKTKIDRDQITDFRLINKFLIHIGYNQNIGDTRSERYRLIRDLYENNVENLNKSESEIEEEKIISSASGLKDKKDSKENLFKHSKKDSEHKPSIIILSSDPNELVNKLRILNQEKIAGIDSKLINTHIEAIVDQLLNLQVINTEEHSNILNL